MWAIIAIKLKLMMLAHKKLMHIDDGLNYYLTIGWELRIHKSDVNANTLTVSSSCYYVTMIYCYRRYAVGMDVGARTKDKYVENDCANI